LRRAVIWRRASAHGTGFTLPESSSSVANYLDHDEWFKREVDKGLSSLDDGKSVSHEEVLRQMERILRS
jgi:predicted transcriptional regulator